MIIKQRKHNLVILYEIVSDYVKLNMTESIRLVIITNQHYSHWSGCVIMSTYFVVALC